MALTKTHIEDCINILGEGYKEVHEWLDEYAKKYNPFTMLEYHRKFRHHAAGVEEVGKKWGHYAEQAAKIHIIRDTQLYVYANLKIMREDQIEEAYQKALKFCHPIPQNDKWKRNVQIAKKKQTKNSSKG